MLTQTNASKALFTRLEKATAATSPKDMAEGRPQNPLSSVHWTLENSPGGYTITMLRGSLIIAQKMLLRQDLFLEKDKVNEPAVDAIVKAMFEDVPALAA